MVHDSTVSEAWCGERMGVEEFEDGEGDDAASSVDLATQPLRVVLEEDTRASEVDFEPMVGQVDAAQVRQIIELNLPPIDPANMNVSVIQRNG